MEQERTRPVRFVLKMRARLLIFRNIGIQKIKATIGLILRKRFLNARLTKAQRFHLSSDQDDTRLNRTFDKIIVPCAAVYRHVLKSLCPI